MNYENYVLGTLSQDAFVMVNKKLARRLGFVEAGLLGELMATYRYAKEQNYFFQQGAKGPWFFLTQSSVEERLGIKIKQHTNAINSLTRDGVIEKKKMGLPAKSYYQINWKKIVDILEESDPEPAPLSDSTKRQNKDLPNVQTGIDETSKLDLTKRQTIKKNLEKQVIKTTLQNGLEEEGQAPFQINDYAFKKFMQEFDTDFPNMFSTEKYKEIYDEMIERKVEFITSKEAITQIRAIQERKRKEADFEIHDFAKYFIGGILKRRTSPKMALNERKLAKGKQDIKEKAEKEHSDNITKLLRGEHVDGLYPLKKVELHNFLD